MSSTPSRQEVGSDKELLFKTALRQLVTKNQLQMPVELQDLMKEDLTTSIQQDQKQLNSKRKLAARIDRLKKAQVKKTEQWESFKKSMREHLQAEHARFEKEQQELSQAIEETQTSLDKAMRGETTTMEQEPMEEEETEFDQWLTDMGGKAPMEHPRDKDKEINAQMDAALKLAQEGQRELARRMHEMQTQMTYMAQIITAPKVDSPTRTPRGHALTGTPDSETRKKRPAVEPFSRDAAMRAKMLATEKDNDTKTQEAAAQQPIHDLERMDGDGTPR